MNALENLIAATREAYLQHREAAVARRLHKLRARMPEPAPRKVSRRRTPAAPQAVAIAPEPLADIDAAAADASHDGARMVGFRIGRTTYRVRQTFARLAAFKRLVLRHRAAFSDQAIK